MEILQSENEYLNIGLDLPNIADKIISKFTNNPINELKMNLINHFSNAIQTGGDVSESLKAVESVSAEVPAPIPTPVAESAVPSVDIPADITNTNMEVVSLIADPKKVSFDPEVKIKEISDEIVVSKNNKLGMVKNILDFQDMVSDLKINIFNKNFILFVGVCILALIGTFGYDIYKLKFLNTTDKTDEKDRNKKDKNRKDKNKKDKN